VSIEAFEKIGVSVHDAGGELKDIQTLFLETIAGIADLDSATAKTDSAFKLLGMSGTKMLPMINEGITGIEAQMKEADRLGATLTQAEVDRAAEFVDAQERVKTALIGIRQELADELNPVMTDSMNALANWIADNGRLFEDVGGFIAGVLEKGYHFMEQLNIQETINAVHGEALIFFDYVTMQVFPELEKWADKGEGVTDSIGGIDKSLDSLSTNLETVIRVWDRFWDAAQYLRFLALPVLAYELYEGLSGGGSSNDGIGIEGSPIETPQVGGLSLPTRSGSLSMPTRSGSLSMPTMAAQAVSSGGAPMVVHITPTVQINGFANAEAMREATRALGPAMGKELRKLKYIPGRKFS